MSKKIIDANQKQELLEILQTRFEKNMNLHKDLNWEEVKNRLEKNLEKIDSLYQMENTGWEPDIIWYDKVSWEYIFCDCSKESPIGRRSLCYDNKALEFRKQFKPENSAVNMAENMGIELLTEKEYRELQKLAKFDLKTSSWLKTPEEIRKLWWAIYGDNRYETTFIYHNWAESYYAARWFRGILRV